MRKATIERNTSETQISMTLNIDGSGKNQIETPVGFLTHMLDAFAKHGIFDLTAKITGDMHVDAHHTIEDAGIVLGEVLKAALGDKRGIKRAGFWMYPMDEVLASVALDLSGRPFLVWDVDFSTPAIGDFPTELFEDFFLGFTNALAANVHVKVHYGRSDHHKIEAVFKALAKSLKTACEIEPRIKNDIPSTKGKL
ncbi:MAG: imidazoleglycerol-phosphate dehydratase HisB [Calditrichia bacterium]